MLENSLLSVVFAIGIIKHTQLFGWTESIMFTFIIYKFLTLNIYPLILSTFFILVCDPSISNAVSLPILLGFDPIQYSMELIFVFCTSLSYLPYFAMVSICFFIALKLAVTAKLTNLSRKLFHFLALLLFIKMERLNVLLVLPLAYLSTYLCFTNFIPIHFPILLKTTRSGKDRFSLPYLLVTLVIGQTHGSRLQFLRLLLSICIHDSFASFTGGFLGKKTKSIQGMAVGFLITCFSEYFITGFVSLQYHALIAVIEYLSVTEDNLTIAMYNIIYHRAADLMARWSAVQQQ